MKTEHTIMDKCVGYLLKSAGSTGKLNQQYIVGSRLNTENPSYMENIIFLCQKSLQKISSRLFESFLEQGKMNAKLLTDGKSLLAECEDE